ncbi:PREDICTED: probable serine/threonine-protein kinase At1g54610 isoform X2 [Nelumbo nucifera]|uniref:Probable serine/threonine-protein kinase At1g54610 isoform X2 n=1 Tax=Nelumbo nucifera TaxID=4432 RepID=A0A1U8A9I8_NELNU|nr:PREDICTED: probable serine/threonine-protein kinase At1g54610 isoform X2 [Nelumbo nucifera]
MGCITSKQAVSVTPAFDHSGAFRDNGSGVSASSLRNRSGLVELENKKKKKKKAESGDAASELGESKRGSSNGGDSFSLRLGNLPKYVEGEQVAAGWPAWLSAVAGEAIQGWVPLKADSFEKLEKVKCYMRQLLSGLEHCHSRGIMHRDIKGSNLLVNNEGILKVADFGLANFYNPGHRQLLTSRVVTLWYRPPELLLGSTEYGASVDLWSVGCVFAELLLGKPILQGKTEVEQLHKIFKLCGSPPDEYWNKSKLPHATIFRPKHPYESCLRETCKDFPATAVNLIEMLLSVEPYKRGTASSALASEYFTTKPYACDPSTLPKYPPNKEIDAKCREEERRRRAGGRVRGPEATRRPTRVCRASRESISKLASKPELQESTKGAHKINGCDSLTSKEDKDTTLCEMPKPSNNTMQEAFHMKYASQGEIPFSGPLHVTASSGFAWAKRRKEDAPTRRSHSRSSSRGQVSNAVDPSSLLQTRNNSDLKIENGEALYGARIDSRDHDSHDIAKRAMLKQWSHLDHPDSFDASDIYHSQELSVALYQREEMAAKRSNLGYQDQGDMVEFSGPLLSQSHRVDELLERHERHIRQAVRRSWFQRGKRHGK